MTEPRITLLDVATRAGVSRTTASFVMTGRRDKRVSADAEERVLRAARELNYRPNLLARSLRTKLTHTLGLISDVIATEPFAGQLIRGCMTSALANDNLVFIGESGGDPVLERQLVLSMLDRGVGGFLYASMFTREVRPAPVFKDHPVVLLNCVSRSLHAPSVIPDEREAGRTAIAALIKAGHRTGIYLVGETPEFVLAARERRAGIEAELAEAGLALAGQIATEWWPEPAFDAVNAFLAEGNRPQAFVCLNDRLALGAYQALQEHGLRVGEDVSVVSFDDSELAQWLRPKLTTVAIPHLELARTAVDLLIAGPSGSATHLVQMPLRERESIAGF